MPRQTDRAIALTFAGLGIMGALAACAPGTGGGSGGTDGGPAADESYTDGTYNADGSYQAPSGTESITVELTLADDVITDITVTPHATDPTASGMQASFASGIAEQVVGQDIDKLNVTRVSGSSLTSGGFTIAIAAIKEQALAS
ncbi:MAG TPA: FMN-binding protein [Pseudolysinimonas sp.]|nr:FMN-binding protein [Pseudolysinimonas sp.]